MKALHIAIGQVIITSILLFVLLPTTGKVIAEDVVVITDIEQVCDEFQDNEVDADLKYRDRFLEVSDSIYNITQDAFTDKPVVWLGRVMCGVRCVFSKQYENDIAQLSDGQNVTIRGWYQDFLLSDIRLSDCILVSTGPPPSNGGDDEECFIATAAYCSPMDSHVDTLRDFRDQYLVTNPVGEGMVSLYYRYSPPMADFIDEHPSLKPVVRAGLLPVVSMSTVAVNTSPVVLWTILGSLAALGAGVLAYLYRRRALGQRTEEI